MSDGVNSVTLLGNLGQDPELRHTGNGGAVLSMRLATNEAWLENGERRDRTEWHTVIVWGKRALGLHPILQKGSKLFVAGRLQTKTWDDKSGTKQYRTEIVASNVILLGGTRSERPVRRAPVQDDHEDPAGDEPEDDIPW
jgi:single-strand DNA-binding protein